MLPGKSLPDCIRQKLQAEARSFGSMTIRTKGLAGGGERWFFGVPISRMQRESGLVSSVQESIRDGRIDRIRGNLASTHDP